MQLPLFFARSTPKAGDRNADPLICPPSAFASGKTGSDQPGMEPLLFPYRVRTNQLMNQGLQIA